MNFFKILGQVCPLKKRDSFKNKDLSLITNKKALNQFNYRHRITLFQQVYNKNSKF